MFATSSAIRSLRRRAMTQLHAWWSFNPLLTVLFLATALIAPLAAAGLLLDDRLVAGAPVWAKTTKFALSMAFYAATLLWLFRQVTRSPRLIRFALNGIALILFLELGLIIVQAARGQMMHFNFATPLDGALYSVMAFSIAVLWVLNMVVALLLLRQPQTNRAFAWSIRLALLLTIVGMGLGYLMTSPSAGQMAALNAGEPGAGTIIGAHTVGAVDGGPGLPLLGWSTTHGDLRIPHFIGLHALQVLPLLGWLISRRRWLPEAQQRSLVLIAAASYLSLMGLVTWQALRGQSIVQPDGVTLLTAAGGVVLTLALVCSTLYAGLRRVVYRPVSVSR